MLSSRGWAPHTVCVCVGGGSHPPGSRAPQIPPCMMFLGSLVPALGVQDGPVTEGNSPKWPPLHPQCMHSPELASPPPCPYHTGKTQKRGLKEAVSQPKGHTVFFKRAIGRTELEGPHI